MALKYAYHPGNIAHSSATEVSQTMDPTARSLGIDLFPMEGATSCGAGIIRQANDLLQVTLNARNFAIAESMGMDIITPCAATAGNLNEDLARLRRDYTDWYAPIARDARGHRRRVRNRKLILHARPRSH